MNRHTRLNYLLFVLMMAGTVFSFPMAADEFWPDPYELNHTIVRADDLKDVIFDGLGTLEKQLMYYMTELSKYGVAQDLPYMWAGYLNRGYSHVELTEAATGLVEQLTEEFKEEEVGWWVVSGHVQALSMMMYFIAEETNIASEKVAHAFADRLEVYLDSFVRQFRLIDSGTVRRGWILISHFRQESSLNEILQGRDGPEAAGAILMDIYCNKEIEVQKMVDFIAPEMFYGEIVDAADLDRARRQGWESDYPHLRRD